MAENKKKTTNNNKKNNTNNVKKKTNNYNKKNNNNTKKNTTNNKKDINIKEIKTPEVFEKDEKIENDVKTLVNNSKEKKIKKADTRRELNINLFLLLSVALVIYIFVTSGDNNNKIEEYKNNIKDLKEENEKLESELTTEYVFLGDSITDKYKMQKYLIDYPVINSGIGGNRTDDLLEQLNKRVFKYKPNKLILLIGINDLLHQKDYKYVINNIEIITNKISKKYPDCKIYIESVYPVNKKWKDNAKDEFKLDETKEEIKKLNEEIKKLCEDKEYTYVDVYPELKNDKEELKDEYTDDGLHPNSKGYEKITEVLIDKIFKED